MKSGLNKLLLLLPKQRNKEIRWIRLIKYPMPVVEELLDELSCAVWFTKLDLRAGYHQIRLHEADEYKTAFKTHVTMNFRLFGLTNAPPTLQSAMNTILAELTRVCVLVFVQEIAVLK